MNEARLTHVDEQGRASMVDVGSKPVSTRTAVARGHIHMLPETIALILSGEIPKGDVFAAARIAGIMAAKKTSELIPLCHPIPLSSVKVELKKRDGCIEIESRVSTSGQTGVEMEALTAVSVAALTLFDMCKAADRTMVIGNIHVAQKSGGQSGDYQYASGQNHAGNHPAAGANKGA